ncbi:MAG TPA: hypothetical protein VF446_01400, partial [Trinickia sp.]
IQGLVRTSVVWDNKTACLPWRFASLGGQIVTTRAQETQAALAAVALESLSCWSGAHFDLTWVNACNDSGLASYANRDGGRIEVSRRRQGKTYTI